MQDRPACEPGALTRLNGKKLLGSAPVELSILAESFPNGSAIAPVGSKPTGLWTGPHDRIADEYVHEAHVGYLAERAVVVEACRHRYNGERPYRSLLRRIPWWSMACACGNSGKARNFHAALRKAQEWKSSVKV